MRESNLLYQRSKKYRDVMDKIHDSIREEDHYEKENNPIGAADTGLRTWGYLKKLMMILDAKDVCDLDHNSGYDLLYWASSLSNNLHNAAIRDTSFLEKKYAFCKEYIEMHKDYLSKGMRNLGNIRRTYAECYCYVPNYLMLNPSF